MGLDLKLLCDCGNSPYYGITEKTPYGDPLTYIPVKQFLSCIIHQPTNKAVAAYVALLPPEQLIGLYYH